MACMQPPGDTTTRKGIFDAVSVGCIPVVFEAASLEGQYTVHLPDPYEVAVLVPQVCACSLPTLTPLTS